MQIIKIKLNSLCGQVLLLLNSSSAEKGSVFVSLRRDKPGTWSGGGEWSAGCAVSV
jgi:hypothetical protein